VERVRVHENLSCFVGSETGKRFCPVGFNYDHDELYRLIEDYWDNEWSKVEADFSAMRQLGANVIRVHLQLNRFLAKPEEPDQKAFEQFDRLLELARSKGLYIDVVGLCCYHRDETPAWYHEASWQERWDIQAFFWQQFARRYRQDPAIFSFDLMNEPVVPGRVRKPGAWLGPEFDGKSFIQFITLDGTREPRIDTARKWIRKLTGSIKNEDPDRLVTLGLVDWSLQKPGKISSGFEPSEIIDDLDYMSAHLYPDEGEPEVMIETMRAFVTHKPMVIDETFHLRCSIEEQEMFLEAALECAEGFVGFYTDQVQSPVTDRDFRRNRMITEWLGIHKKFAPRFLNRELPAAIDS
jgi:hypothetical protein